MVEVFEFVAGLPPTVQSVVLADQFPSGDVDAMRRAARSWRYAAAHCNELKHVAEQLLSPLGRSVQGSAHTGTAAEDSAARLRDSFDETARYFEALAEELDTNADEVEKAQALMLAAVSLALMSMAAGVSGVGGVEKARQQVQMASRALIVATEVRGSAAWRKRSEMLLRMSVFGATQGAMDLVIQVWQPHRKEVDWNSVWAQVAAGAGSAVGVGAAHYATRVMWGDGFGRRLLVAATAGIAGVVGGVTGAGVVTGEWDVSLPQLVNGVALGLAAQLSAGQTAGLGSFRTGGQRAPTAPDSRTLLRDRPVHWRIGRTESAGDGLLSRLSRSADEISLYQLRETTSVEFAGPGRLGVTVNGEGGSLAASAGPHSRGSATTRGSHSSFLSTVHDAEGWISSGNAYTPSRGPDDGRRPSPWSGNEKQYPAGRADRNDVDPLAFRGSAVHGPPLAEISNGPTPTLTWRSLEDPRPAEGASAKSSAGGSDTLVADAPKQDVERSSRHGAAVESIVDAPAVIRDVVDRATADASIDVTSHFAHRLGTGTSLAGLVEAHSRPFRAPGLADELAAGRLIFGVPRHPTEAENPVITENPKTRSVGAHLPDRPTTPLVTESEPRPGSLDEQQVPEDGRSPADKPMPEAGEFTEQRLNWQAPPQPFLPVAPDPNLPGAPESKPAKPVFDPKAKPDVINPPGRLVNPAEIGDEPKPASPPPDIPASLPPPVLPIRIGSNDPETPAQSTSNQPSPGSPEQAGPVTPPGELGAATGSTEVTGGDETVQPGTGPATDVFAAKEAVGALLESVDSPVQEGVPGFTGTDSADVFFDALRKAARKASADTGRGPLEEIQQFTLHRALSRIFTQNPHDWVLKGGQAMLARMPGARPSSDIDLVRITNGGREAMVADCRAALARDHGDPFRFEPESEIDVGSCVRQSYRAFIGTKEIMLVVVDINPARDIPLWGDPQMVRFPDQILRTEAMGREPDLRLISLNDVLTHKIFGIHTPGQRTELTRCDNCVAIGPGRYECPAAPTELPYRPQDLADLLILARTTRIEGEKLQSMLRQEFDHRRTEGNSIKMPNRFELPNPDWANWFSVHLPIIDLLPFRTLNEALPLARGFLDPLLGTEPLRGSWEPSRLRWSQTEHSGASLATDATTKPGTNAVSSSPTMPDGIRRLEGTGEGEASRLVADTWHIGLWDRLVGNRDQPGSLDYYLDRLATDKTKDISGKLSTLDADMDSVGYGAREVAGIDDKHLRFYSHQSGEAYIHSAALILDPETTIEVAYQPRRIYGAAGLDAHQSHFAYRGELPAGMTAADANTVAFWRWVHGQTVDDVPHSDMVRDLLDLHAQPFREALRYRRRLIEDFGIDPRRIRIARDREGRGAVYLGTRWIRAHLFALSRLRDNPVLARETLVNALLGDGQQADSRSRRVQAMLDRVLAAHEGGGQQPKKYTLLWVRDSRPFSSNGPQLDTRPEFVRQIIEMSQERQPDRTILLVGDDLFAERAGLREAWQQVGSLNGVDIRTLVKYWEADHLTRAEQTLFFYRLATQRDIVQIGMESGALEMQNLLGVPTVYLSARGYEGNKANRWLHYTEPWQYGRTVEVPNRMGAHLRDTETGLPTLMFQKAGELLPAPLDTLERIPFGHTPPETAEADEDSVVIDGPAKVSLTTTRIINLIESGELGRWEHRLGWTAGMAAAQWVPWTERDWQTSAFYADQLHRWLRTTAENPRQVDTKWDAIRLALKGIVEPGYTRDEGRFSYTSVTAIHPYFELHNDQPVPADSATPLARAYAMDLAVRPAAVAAALKEMFSSVRIHHNAIKDLSVFRLEPPELDSLHQAIDRVVSRNMNYRISPYCATPTGSAWDSPGAATHSMRPPMENIHLPTHTLNHILDGDHGGGGHRHGTGMPRKTEFPARWSDDTVARWILDIAVSPDRATFAANGRWNVSGERDGVEVRVVILPDGQVWTAWPTSGRGVSQNPPADNDM
ncbi:EndoU domain-containing protein [Nocardia brasiliensis]|uniref:EndoU domain-containing protein n=1 Tax=Nocardia brasiliensis TaxID=37326 RepID=UPI0024583C7B|nr:EndoU domain-containing protein [Nocardia brasiliensis]